MSGPRSSLVQAPDTQQAAVHGHGRCAVHLVEWVSAAACTGPVLLATAKLRLDCWAALLTTPPRPPPNPQNRARSHQLPATQLVREAKRPARTSTQLIQASPHAVKSLFAQSIIEPRSEARAFNKPRQNRLVLPGTLPRRHGQRGATHVGGRRSRLSPSCDASHIRHH